MAGSRSALGPECLPVLHRLERRAGGRQLAADLAINQRVKGRDEGQTLIGALGPRQLAAIVAQKDTPGRQRQRRRNRNALDFTYHQGSWEKARQGLRRGGSSQFENMEKAPWVDPDTWMSLAAEAAALAADKWLGMAGRDWLGHGHIGARRATGKAPGESKTFKASMMTGCRRTSWRLR